MGFLYENLWEARLVMNKFSFGIVWTIFLVNFVYEFFILQLLPLGVQPMVPGLLVVFCLGLVLATFEFMFAFMHAAKPPLILSGSECCSSTVRSEKHEKQLAIVACWYEVRSRAVPLSLGFRLASKTLHTSAPHSIQVLKVK